MANIQNIDITDFINYLYPQIIDQIENYADAENIDLNNEDINTMAANILIQHNNPTDLHATIDNYVHDTFDQANDQDQSIKLIDYQKRDRDADDLEKHSEFNAYINNLRGTDIADKETIGKHLWYYMTEYNSNYNLVHIFGMQCVRNRVGVVNDAINMIYNTPNSQPKILALQKLENKYGSNTIFKLDDLLSSKDPKPLSNQQLRKIIGFKK